MIRNTHNLYQCPDCCGHTFILIAISSDVSPAWSVIALCQGCGREGKNLGVLVRQEEEKL